MAKAWHREDIKAAVRKRGITLTALALKHGLSENACRAALSEPRYHAEQVIAALIGVPAYELWPSRYDPDGTPRHPVIRRDLTAGRTPVHRQKRRAA